MVPGQGGRGDEEDVKTRTTALPLPLRPLHSEVHCHDYPCSSRLKPFCGITSFSLSHGVFGSVVRQQTTMNSSGLSPSAQRNLTTSSCSTEVQSYSRAFTLISHWLQLDRLQADRCSVRVRITQSLPRAWCISSVSSRFGYRVIFKLLSLFYSLSYLTHISSFYFK